MLSLVELGAFGATLFCMAVATGNTRVTSTISEAELHLIERVAKDKGFRSVGMYLVAAGRLMKRLDMDPEAERELTKPLV